MEAVPHAVDPQRVAQHGDMVIRLVDEIFPLVEGFYVDLHRNPELSHQEHRTAGAVAEWLTRAGFEVETGIGGTGVVGVLRNGEGPTVLLRGDMDALPLEEKTGLPYASTARGTDGDGNDVPIMHACGHDVHTACLVGAADLLSDSRNRWSGTLIIVAQPAEETLDGAAAMLSDGLYTRFGRPDVALAQHVGPQPAGMVAHRAGTILGTAATFRVRIFGTGGDACQPHTTIDPVLIAANIITRLQTIVAREVNPSEMAVVTVGMVRAGSTGNLIPEDAYLEINTRALNETVAARLHTAVDRIVRAEAAASGAPQEPEITVVHETGVTRNDPGATREIALAHRAYFGDAYVVELPEPFTSSEDFGRLGLPGDPDPVPYVYWFVGATPHDVWEAAPGETPYERLSEVPNSHSPFFAPDREHTLRVGIAAMTIGALTYLGRVEDIAPTGAQPAMPYGMPPEPPIPAPEPLPYSEPVPEPYAEPGPAPMSAQNADMDAPVDEDDRSGGTGESTVYTDMDALLDEDGDTAMPFAPPQGPPIAAPPPQGPPIAAPPPPPDAAPYPTDHRPADPEPMNEPPYDPYDPAQEPPQEPPYRL